MNVKTAITRSLLLLVFYDASSLIIPEEVPTILSLLYSNIPPVKKGTDSRFGIGFRLGEHADFQMLFELGPQTETDPIGTSSDAKRRRDTTFSAAMKGELGPLAQAVAKYQLERRLQKEMDKLKAMEKNLKKVQAMNKSENQDNIANNWLTKWREEISQSSEHNVQLSPIQNIDGKIMQQRIEKPLVNSGVQKDKVEELTKLYKSQNINKNLKT
ncbi:uncharacterized protein snsl [Linepithema humile]|uniref:uncharacterized protein snsl n=1 Tax=Linepithema humile TaxID=83485 RepID=UPI0006230BA6|nr:PREDICTED: uncharacterized protein LOC105676721 [Linepithema humile]XP_012230250.1 PREDICTED: uncharacterized protein LOC105676721 [Linepithema humile]XP_012230251.1 PREDICTED: uncharacterized protein LOC105676721 [Linepithema humile]